MAPIVYPPGAESCGAAYVHVPFCRHRCGYCNFAVVVARPDLVPRFLHAIEQEVALRVPQRQPLDSLFLGGGTPTQIVGPDLVRLLSALQHAFILSESTEFSVEANPEDVTCELVSILQRFGVNRVSLGVQSFDDRKLALLERGHDAASVTECIQELQKATENISLDLIFGAPGETLDDWRRDLEHALALQPKHVSTYGLTFERGTRFWSSRLHGQLQGVAEDAELAMYEAAIEMLTSAGYEHYEVSNFALPGYRCRHNEKYWNGESFYGFGPGAARYLSGCRAVNHRSTTTYLKKIEAGLDPTAESEQLAPVDRARERLVFGLRRMQGVSRTEFHRDTGFSLFEIGGVAMQRHLDEQRFEWSGDYLRLTSSGLLVSDAIWPDFLEM